MTDAVKRDPLDEAADRLINGLPTESIRKIDLKALQDADQDKFDKVVEKVTASYTDRNSWEVHDPMIKQYIDPIEDEEYDMNIQEDSDETIRTRKVLADPNKIASMLGLNRRAQPSAGEGEE